jgi:hypothetical protein
MNAPGNLEPPVHGAASPQRRKEPTFMEGLIFVASVDKM